MRKLPFLLALVATLGLSACNTWSGIVADTKAVGTAVGSGVEKTGEAIQKTAK